MGDFTNIHTQGHTLMVGYHHSFELWYTHTTSVTFVYVCMYVHFIFVCALQMARHVARCCYYRVCEWAYKLVCVSVSDQIKLVYICVLIFIHKYYTNLWTKYFSECTHTKKALFEHYCVRLYLYFCFYKNISTLISVSVHSKNCIHAS